MKLRSSVHGSQGKRRRSRDSSSDESFRLSKLSDDSSSGGDEGSSKVDQKESGITLTVFTSDSDLEELEVSEARGRKKRKETRKARQDRPSRTSRTPKVKGTMLFWQSWQNEIESWLDEVVKEDVNADSEVETFFPDSREPSSDVILPLLRFQKEWLAWSLKQEDSFVKGGILADEMGMGKTVQAISLVLTARSLRHTVSDSLFPLGLGLPRVAATLVICPVVAVVQWVNEIARFTANNCVKVLVYHGAHRDKGGSKQFAEYDFVITTYSTVEADYRKTLPPKKKCNWCGKLFNPDKITVHQKYYCGPDAVKTEKQAKQFRKKKNGSKVDGQADLDDHDDGDVKSSKKKHKTKNVRKNKMKPTEMDDPGDGIPQVKFSVLHMVKWERIILDEAHYIKERRSNTARAILSLDSTYKWALSGTPLQNRVGELYSLIRFLQVIPYSFYFCKDCDCRSLDYSKSVECQLCNHAATRHFCWWNKYIAKPIQKYGYVREGKRAMILLKKKLLPAVVLRRTKKGRAADLALPPRNVTIRRDDFNVTEEDYYEALYSRSRAQFDTYVEAGTLMNNYAHIFDLLTRLRQAVDHPYLVIYSASASVPNVDIKDDEDQICGICHEVAEVPVVASCEHLFCKTCLMDYSSVLEKVTCPSCSKPLTVDFSEDKRADTQAAVTTLKGFRRSSILNRIKLEEFQTSTKIEALREEIRFMLEDDGSAKAIIFSQFTSFLDLIHYSLDKSGIKCVQLVGSMSISARDEAIKKFTNDPNYKIFLMSLKAGGVALNLTVASYVFLMDPWWNPAVEQQAQDRIHRIGQYKPVRTVRFVIENSVEERILRLQEKKQLVFEGTVGGSNEALGRLTEADLRFLFHS